jgi:cardiolipin synthase
VTLVVFDSEFGQQMETIFRNDLRQAKPVDYAEFRDRPFTEHIKEWAANQVTRVL